MHRPGTTRYFARIILAWYLLFLAASLASAAIDGGPYTLVCSANGQIKWVAGQDDTPSVVQHGMDCPLCAGFFLPPPPAQHRTFDRPGAHAIVFGKEVPRHGVRTAAPPLPSRGPPGLHHTL